MASPQVRLASILLSMLLMISGFPSAFQPTTRASQHRASRRQVGPPGPGLPDLDSARNNEKLTSSGSYTIPLADPIIDPRSSASASVDDPAPTPGFERQSEGIVSDRSVVLEEKSPGFVQAFDDVPPTNPFYAQIEIIKSLQVTLGCGVGNNYCPNDPVTREQMAAFILRSLGEFSPPAPPNQRFVDVPPSNIFYNFIDRIAALGITVGCPAPNYCPAAQVTRGQMVTFLERAVGRPDPPVPAQQRFVDVPPTHTFYSFAESFVQHGMARGAMNVFMRDCAGGLDGQHFCPDRPLTRAEMAALLVIEFGWMDGYTSNARLDPVNRTGRPGEDLFSGNCNWSLPVLGLPGRAGLDLGLSLSYNSLVWTKVSPTMILNAENEFSPGFHIGFPIIQTKYSNSQAGGEAYLLLMPSGSRVELRRAGSTNEYDSADSSYLRLDDNGGTLLLRSTDGTQLTYSPSNSPINLSRSGDYRCTQIKDRNGNYLTVNYHPAFGYITTIVDTLARTVTFNYDGLARLTSISQTWGGVPHTWASYSYSSLTVNTNFCDPALGTCLPNTSNMSVCGPPNSGVISVLSQLIYSDGSHYDFDYTTWAQVWRIRHIAFDGHQLGYISYDLPQTATSSQSDCPRFSHRNDQAENWNNNAPAITSYSIDRGSGLGGQAILPDNTVNKEYAAASGWQKGLTTQREVWVSGVRKSWTTFALAQDNTALPYPLNPRVVETNVYDEVGNRRRTVTSYTTFGLPGDIYEFTADAATVLRRTHTDYNLSSVYTDRRIIGLPSFQYLYDGTTGALLSQFEYIYDNASLQIPTPSAPTQHDEVNYGIGFITGRGNLSKTRRYDVTNQTFVEYKTQHDTAGSVTFTRDPLAHQTTFDYADFFADGVNRNTFAYPTNVTDGDLKHWFTQYDYSMGAVRVTTDPLGASRTTTYDSAGRVSRVDISNGAYTRYVYPVSQTEIDSFSLVQIGGTEFQSTQILDGAGRVRATASSFFGSTGGYRGQYTAYDVRGRVSQQSNPTEINSTWTPAGDDQNTGWRYTRQDYDWKGRPTLTTNTDLTTRLLTYAGCSCAGGEVITAQDEVGRQQRMTHDVLGRLVKEETLNMDPNHSVYSTRTNTYNARDQLTGIYIQLGMNGAGQQTLMTYDGHGRLHSRKLPIEDSSTPGTVYTYYDDDEVQTVTDARDAHSTYTYNGRHLVTGTTYCTNASCTTRPQSPKQIDAISPTPAVSFTYDDAGNRLSMYDGLGYVNYHYDTWSRLRWETRYFTDLGASYTLNYDYNLAGGLKQVIDPFNAVVNYSYNDSGQMTGATATGYPGVTTFASSIQYRAWGALKHGSYRTASNGNTYSVDASYDVRLSMTHYSQGATRLDYQHFADGRVSFAGDLSSPSIFDRAYGYDNVGRLSQCLTGTEARGGAIADGPFKQTYSYDVFDNMNTRHNRFWSQPDDLFTATYLNDRNIAWTYDVAGNIRLDSLSHRYDVMSRPTHIEDPKGIFTVDQSYDGDGQPAKRIEQRPSLNYPITTYFVTSSLLGEVITELSASGINSGTHKSHVYQNGTEIALYDSWINQVVTKLSDPVIGQGLDPLGGYSGFADPFVQNPNTTYDSLHPGEPLYYQDADPFDLGSGCELDGMPTDCSRLAHLLENGTAGIQIGAGGKILTQQTRGQFDPSIDGTIPVWVPNRDLDGSWTPYGNGLRITATSISGYWVQGVGASRVGFSLQQGKGRLFKDYQPNKTSDEANDGSLVKILSALMDSLANVSTEKRIQAGNKKGLIMNLDGTLHNHQSGDLFDRGHKYYPREDRDRPCMSACIRAQPSPCNTWPNGCWDPPLENPPVQSEPSVRAPTNPARLYYADPSKVPAGAPRFP